MRLQCILMSILLSFNALADGFSPAFTSQDQPWSVIASFGDGQYQLDSKERQNPIARLALGNELLLTGDCALGLELGLQNGNDIQLTLPQETLSRLKWLPVRTTLSPMLDFLVTAKSDPLWDSLFFAQLKGGLAYRYWQIKQNQFNSLSQVAGEIQAGFGIPISALAELNLLYQGVYGAYSRVYINTANQTASVSNIPSLHALLLGLSFTL